MLFVGIYFCFAQFLPPQVNILKSGNEIIRDNYPKFVLTRNDPIQHRSGIIHENLTDLIGQNRGFTDPLLDVDSEEDSIWPEPRTRPDRTL